MSVTRFEIEHGYSPCTHTLARDGCHYSGSETDCDKTIELCRELGMIACFGGYPSTDPDVIRARAEARIAEMLARWRAEDDGGET